MSGDRAIYGGKGEEGIVYVLILFLLVVTSTLGLAFLQRAGIDTAASVTRGAGMRAQYLAEGAANHALWRLLNEEDFPASDQKYYMHSLAGGRYGYKVRRHTETRFATIATVGIMGENAVHQSYVVFVKKEIPPVVSGSYEGDGNDNRSITGVGFQPDAVIIKSANARGAVLRTSTISGDSTKPMTGAGALAPNLIQSLTADGFTLGSDERVNGDGVDYFWIAFRAASDRMKVGTYTGDGSPDREITGLGFNPQLIIALSEEGDDAVFRSPASDLSFDFGNGEGLPDCLTTPLPDKGFRLGGDGRVNRVGVTYHYICWPGIEGKQKFSSYAGDGTDGREITGLGFEPAYVILRCVDSGQDTVHRTVAQGTGADLSLYFAAAANDPDRIQALGADGFQVGQDDDVNNPLLSYAFLAWKGE